MYTFNVYLGFSDKMNSTLEYGQSPTTNVKSPINKWHYILGICSFMKLTVLSGSKSFGCLTAFIKLLRLKLSVYLLYFLNIWQFFFFSLEEDTYSSYARQLSKYFLAEGVISGHSIFLASAEPEPNDILKVINISVFHNLG